MSPRPSAINVSLQKKKINIVGAKVHNLKNVSVGIPRNRLVVITGPSGSGKSSLAFDTLYAEGQRQYIESLSVYSRQFFHQLECPEVDRIEGLQPTISIDQHVGVSNPRSTVGTMTEIYDYLRLLFARLGTASCPKCGRAIQPLLPEQIVETLMSLPEGTRLMLIAPIVKKRRGNCLDVFELIRRAGYVRARVDGVILELDNAQALDATKPHTVEAIVDRIVVREASRGRLVESVNLGLRHGGGQIIATIEHVGSAGCVWRDRAFSIKNACPICNIKFDALEPRMFSFNSPYGICATCEGFGHLEKFDPDLVLTDKSLSLASGAVGIWKSVSEATLKRFRSQLSPCLAVLGIRWNTPLDRLDERQVDFLLYGSQSDMFDLEEYLNQVSAIRSASSISLDKESQPSGVGASSSHSNVSSSLSSVSSSSGVGASKALKGAFKSSVLREDDEVQAIAPRAFVDDDEERAGSSSVVKNRKPGDEKKASRKKAEIESILESEPAANGEDSAIDFSADMRKAKDDSSISFGVGSLTDLAAKTSLSRKLPKIGDKVRGIFDILNEEYQHGSSIAFRSILDSCRGRIVCPACGGSRLRAEALNVRIGNSNRTDFMHARTISEISSMSVAEVLNFFEHLEFDEEDEFPIAEPIVSQILPRLQFLEQVGLGYLTLNRSADTLSGGEFQRVRLAGGLGSGLVGVCYILDEPSIGLHPRDNQRLIDTLRQLQRMDNTVLVVEHDEAIMRQSDWIIDVGPGAGEHGGTIVAEGTPESIQNHPRSLTGQYLRERSRYALRRKRRPVNSRTKYVSIEGVSTNNLQDVTADFPLNHFVCVTGVSGSGKSSLVNETLAPALIRRLGGVSAKPGPYEGLRGAHRIGKVILVNQAPIGRTPRSNPATYMGIFDEIRKVYAGTREAKLRGYKTGRFSFNVRGGRCEHCQGQGVQKIEMNFLPDIYVACPECEGKRFNSQTLEIKYKGKSIADILKMKVDEAAEFFANFPAIKRPLDSLMSVGLGYLELGQPSTTLSGGEAQRIKLAAELNRTNAKDTLYILDEPTTGLHFADVERLLNVLHDLVDRGNSVIVIEHNLDVIASADWIIDLGPEGGSAGGFIVTSGAPDDVIQVEESRTGNFLREYIKSANK
ncbi:MAG: excinuclease ABC subunit UvrA [Planctomycetia bacterium]|nr:excinuclease ABC subunit UvrA [Planctomycetia bacterium]